MNNLRCSGLCYLLLLCSFFCVSCTDKGNFYKRTEDVEDNKDKLKVNEPLFNTEILQSEEEPLSLLYEFNSNIIGSDFQHIVFLSENKKDPDFIKIYMPNGVCTIDYYSMNPRDLIFSDSFQEENIKDMEWNGVFGIYDITGDGIKEIFLFEQDGPGIRPRVYSYDGNRFVEILEYDISNPDYYDSTFIMFQIIGIDTICVSDLKDNVVDINKDFILVKNTITRRYWTYDKGEYKMKLISSHEEIQKVRKENN